MCILNISPTQTNVPSSLGEADMINLVRVQDRMISENDNDFSPFEKEYSVIELM